VSIDIANLLQVARSAVAIGYKLLGSTSTGNVHAKSDRDYVTDLDFRIQSEIRHYLAQETPSIGFYGEELADDQPDRTTNDMWVLDPIDGTSNYIHGLPLCAVSLALTRNTQPIVGVIAAPFLNLEYYATADGGSYVNDNPISVSVTDSLQRAIVSVGDYAVGANANQKNTRRFAITSALAENVERVRMFGSAALDLAWVAEGRIDACVILSNKPWDTAAGVLIAREAGALVTDANGDDHTSESHETVAVTPTLAKLLRPLLQ